MPQDDVNTPHPAVYFYGEASAEHPEVLDEIEPVRVHFDQLNGASARWDGYQITLGSGVRNNWRSGEKDRVTRAYATLWHELGHVYDARRLTWNQRRQLMDLWNYFRWWDGDYAEQCAEAFARAFAAYYAQDRVGQYMAPYLDTWGVHSLDEMDQIIRG